MIPFKENHKTPPAGLMPRDNVKKAVSDTLKLVDAFIRKGDLDQAEQCVLHAREIDPKNIYAYAFEERIQMLKEQAHENSIAADRGKSTEEERTREVKPILPLATQKHDDSMDSEPVSAPAQQTIQYPETTTHGQRAGSQSTITDVSKPTPDVQTQTQGAPCIYEEIEGEVATNEEHRSGEDRNLKIQRIIKIAVDAARKEMQHNKIAESRQDGPLHDAHSNIVEAAEAVRRAEENRQREVGGIVQERLLPDLHERQESNLERFPIEQTIGLSQIPGASFPSPRNTVLTNQGRQETLSRYKLVLLSAWADGAVSANERATLSELRRSLSISDEEHLRLEEEVKRETYIEAFKNAWNSGMISPENASILTELRDRFQISAEEHTKIESALLWETRPPRNRPTLLVVDDDERLLTIVSNTLNQAGFITRPVTTSDEAYSYLREASPDLILCDVNLETSTMGGFEFYQKVRELDQLRETPFIFLSGLSDDALVRAGKELGADDYLSKPVSEEALVATIKGKLRRYHELKNQRN